MENSMENSSSNHSKRKRPNLSVLGLRRRSSSSNPPLLDLQDGGQRSGRSESFQPSQQPPIPASPPHLEVSKIISQNPTKTPEENNNGNNNGNDLFYHTRKKRKIVYTKERRRRRSAKSLPQPSAPNEIDIDEETDDEKDPPLLDLQDGGRRSGRSESFQPSQQPPIPASPPHTKKGMKRQRNNKEDTRTTISKTQNACRGLMPSVYKEGGRRGRSASKAKTLAAEAAAAAAAATTVRKARGKGKKTLAAEAAAAAAAATTVVEPVVVEIDINEETDDENELSDRTKRSLPSAPSVEPIPDQHKNLIPTKSRSTLKRQPKDFGGSRSTRSSKPSVEPIPDQHKNLIPTTSRSTLFRQPKDFGGSLSTRSSTPPIPAPHPPPSPTTDKMKEEINELRKLNKEAMKIVDVQKKIIGDQKVRIEQLRLYEDSIAIANEQRNFIDVQKKRIKMLEIKLGEFTSMETELEMEMELWKA